MISRINDFFKDQRFLWNQLVYSWPTKKVSNLSVVLTFDIEQTYGSKGKKEYKNAQNFFRKLETNLEGKPSTLFLQADIIKYFSIELQNLNNKHELGLHCYKHEGLWGNQAWFLNEKKLSSFLKKNALKKSLQIFSKYNLARPLSFRAPNLIIDQESLDLLEEYGFKIDSSSASFRQKSKIKKINNLWEMPVSQFGKVETNWSSIIPIRNFKILNMGNILRLNKKIWQKDLVSYPYNNIIFMGHNWDFNKEKLMQLTNFLEANFKVEYQTLQQLKKKYEL